MPGIRRLLALTVLAWLAACAQPGRPVVAERSPVFGDPSGSYQVQPGDTLYSIAWRFGLDYRALAEANGIAAPYTIRTGQIVRLAVDERGGRQTGRPARSRPAAPPATPSAAPPPVATAPAASSAPGRGGWRAPTDAPARRGFGRGNRGIDYALEVRHRVQAAAGGEVVYAGSGLGGFRHLVIVKHDSDYLSAYSLNRPVAVREGQRIKAGEILADTDQEGGPGSGALHFEIRRNGDPVDPGPLIGR